MQGAREGPEASRGANTLLRDVVRVPSLWGRRVGRVAPGPECVGPKGSRSAQRRECAVARCLEGAWFMRKAGREGRPGP